MDGCPLHNQIPDWLALTAEGHYLDAAHLLQNSGCMGEIYSNLCTRPCEGSCILEGKDEPVAIFAIERFLHEYVFSHGGLATTPPAPLGQKVAVMDAGPCGLTCAFDLVRQGYSVTIFDTHAFPGGLLSQGVPAFKMDQTLVQRRIELLKQLGVKFQLGIHYGPDFPLARLRQDFDAVFFGSCADEARPLTIPGADLPGVHQGLTLIVQRFGRIPLEIPPIELQDRRVVVLGAGDTAMDCLRTAIRSGAREALCLYRQAETEVPASEIEYRNAAEEGAKFRFFTNTTRLEAGPDGRVATVVCEPTADAPAPAMAGREFTIPADVVLVAYGFTNPPFPTVADYHEVRTSPAGRVCVDQHSMTNLAGVFAGGTLVHDLNRVVDAVRDARDAARDMHRYLSAKRG